jgi:hypothetical protein
MCALDYVHLMDNSFQLERDVKAYNAYVRLIYTSIIGMTIAKTFLF